MKRHSSGDKNKESHHQSTSSKNRKKQSATPPRPPSYSQSLPRKLHLQSKPSCTSRGNPTAPECEPSQNPTLHETLLARKYQHQHQQPPTSTSAAPFSRSRNACNTGRPMYSETLRPQKQHRRNSNRVNQLPHDVEIHQDALNNLTELHEQRIRMLTKMQSSQNKLNTHFKTRLHHNSEQLEETKQRQRDQDNRICELRSVVDHLEHNLMQHVESIESLKELIARATTTTGSSSSDDDQNQGRNIIETETAQTEEEGTSPTSSSDDGTDDGDDEDFHSEEEKQQQTNPMECPNQMRAEQMAKDKRVTKIYGAPDTIRYLNQTLTGRTIDSFGTRRSSESSGYTLTRRHI